MPLGEVVKLENVADKVFLVTGGAAGVGAGIVRRLLHENARYVAFLDIAERDGSILEFELLGKFGALRAKFIKCDITEEAQLSAAFKQVFDKYRRLDVVVNNAAVIGGQDSDYKRIVDINMTATINSTLKALELMGVDKGGSGGAVVNVSTLDALKPKPYLPVYNATKIAVLQFSNSIGAETHFSKTKVRVITVCLGPTDTALLLKRINSDIDKDFELSPTSSVDVRQRVDSAAKGIVQVINCGHSASTWMIADDKEPVDISKNISDGFETMSDGIKYVD